MKPERSVLLAGAVIALAALAGVGVGEEAVVDAHLGRIAVRRRHPVQVALDLVVVSARRAGLRVREVLAHDLDHLADLLAEDRDGAVPQQASILDIGTGANLIYPLIGVHEYHWRFTGRE